MASIEQLAERVASVITPNKQEADAEKLLAQELIARLERALPEAKGTFVGSAARDTGLKNDRDIDLFLRFPQVLSKEYITEKTVTATKKAIKAKWEMHYAEHPYLQTTIKGFQVEVIPCFDIKPHEQIKSAVDRSPLHMNFLEKNLTEKQKRDVRVLKQILKNAGIYGAELAVEGFSGIMCEYLILNYHSFENTVKNAAEWKPPVRIDFGESSKQFNTPLVLIDAIDRNRNVAAVISETNVNRFITLCRAFVEKPSLKFFFSEKPRYTRRQVLAAVKKRGTLFLFTPLKKPPLVEDVFVPQLKRTEKNLARQLTLKDFKVIDSASWTEHDECFILIEVEQRFLSRVRQVQGPPASNAPAVKQFLAGKKPLRGPFVKNGFVYAEQERRYVDALQAFNDMKKKPVEAGVASAFKNSIRKAKTLQTPPSKATQKTGEYLFKKEPWW